MNTPTELDLIGALAIFLLEKTGSVYGTFKGRITADEQRRAFGCVPFGKLQVTIDGEKETVRAYRKVCFGTDFECSSFGWLEFESICRSDRHPFALGRHNSKYNHLPL